MKFKIHFQLPDGLIDYLILEADTIEEIRLKASYETSLRNAVDSWSESLDPKTGVIISQDDLDKYETEICNLIEKNKSLTNEVYRVTKENEYLNALIKMQLEDIKKLKEAVDKSPENS